MTWPHGLVTQPESGAPESGAPPAAAAEAAMLMWAVFSLVGEAMLLVCCAEFLATRRSTALPAAILVWHALTFSVPALLPLPIGEPAPGARRRRRRAELAARRWPALRPAD
eukprot:scaffold18980_cov163-Isochrysis_galbana.AAC.1